MNQITGYTENNFSAIEQYDGVAVIRFQAAWCAPCRQSETAFDAAAQALSPGVIAGKADVLQAPVLAAKYNVSGLPNILIFKQGQVAGRLAGPVSAAQITAAVQQILQSS